MPHSSDCDCPFCPLVKADVQVCAVIVKLNLGKGTANMANVPPQYNQFRGEFITIALYGRQKLLERKGEKEFTMYSDDFTMSVSNVMRNVYKICFHKV